MHELRLASSLIDAVVAAMRREQVSEVVGISVEVGALSGVDAEALSFGFTVAREGTPLAQATLKLARVPLQLTCTSCSKQWSPPALDLLCERCGPSHVQITAGRDLIVRSMEVR